MTAVTVESRKINHGALTNERTVYLRVTCINKFGPFRNFAMWKQTAILIPVSEQRNRSTGVKAPLWAPEIFETHYTFPMPQMAQCLSLAQSPYETRHKTTSTSRLKPAFPPYLTLLCTLLLLLSLKPTHQNHNILLTVCIVLPLLALKWGFPFTVIHLFVYVCVVCIEWHFS